MKIARCPILLLLMLCLFTQQTLSFQQQKQKQKQKQKEEKVEPKQWTESVLNLVDHLQSLTSLNDPFGWQLDEIASKFERKQSKRSHTNKFIPQIQDEIREYVKGLMSCYDTLGLTLSVVFNDELIIAEGFGLRDLESNLPVNNETIFSIGSTTKAFSGLLAAMSVSDGKMSWDTPIHEYIPDFQLENKFANERACTRDVLSHKVGMPRNDILFISNPNVTYEESIRRLRYFPNVKDFRTEFEYNNWLVFVGGYTAAKVQGLSWEQMLQERILNPLGMKRTTPNVESALPLGNLAESYIPSLNGRQVLPRDVNKVLNLISPAGSMHSTALDMAQWMNFQLNNGKTESGQQLVSPEEFYETRARQFSLLRTQDLGSITETILPASFFLIDYGFGWNSGSYRGRRTLSHSGQSISHSSLVHLVPDHKLGIFMSGNGMIFDSKIEALASSFITDLLLGLDPWLNVSNSCNFPCSFLNCTSSKEVSYWDNLFGLEKLAKNLPEPIKDTRILNEFVGNYYDPGYDTLYVTLIGNELRIKFNDIQGPMVSFPGQGQDVLFAMPEYWYNLIYPIVPLYFNRDSTGAIVSVTIPSMEPKAPPTFFKV